MDVVEIEKILRDEIQKYLTTEMSSYKVDNAILIIPKDTDDLKKLMERIGTPESIEKYDMASYEIVQSNNGSKCGYNLHLSIHENTNRIECIPVDIKSKNELFPNVDSNSCSDIVDSDSDNMGQDDLLIDVDFGLVMGSGTNIKYKKHNSKSELKEIKKMLYKYLNILSSILSCKNNTICWTHNDFIKSLSHQIKTPLNGMAIGIQILDETLIDNYHQNIINYLIQSCVELSTYINDIIDYYQLVQNSIEFVIADFDIRSDINKIQEIYQSQFDDKNIVFESNISGIIPQNIQTDGKRICQTLINLIKNSITHTQDGRIIVDIQYQNVENKLVISVIDTGKNIPLEERHKIFRPFYQIGKSEIQEGLGLGLSIAKHIIEKMHGEIYLIDDKYVEHIGTAIQFWIPLSTKISNTNNTNKTLIKTLINTPTNTHTTNATNTHTHTESNKKFNKIKTRQTVV